MALFAVLWVAATATGIGVGSASAGTTTCTLTGGKGEASYGIVFGGSNAAIVRAGCRLFARSSHFHLSWGVHNPSHWVVSAEYVNPKLMMTALLVAPRPIEQAVFLLTNRSVFTSHGWVLVKRH